MDRHVDSLPPANRLVAVKLPPPPGDGSYDTHATTVWRRQYELPPALWQVCRATCLALLAGCLGCGPGTRESPTVALSDIRDGKDNTFIAAELTPERSVPWTQPVDIVFDDQFPRFDSERSMPNPTFLGLADGGVFSFFIQPEIDRQRFRDACTIASGERRVRSDVIAVANYYPEGFELPSPLDALGAGSDRAALLEAATAHGVRMKRFKRVMQALHSYHRQHDHFPPAVVYGRDGKPWHSWRVLILPYLGYEYLYKEYDLSVPWDDPKNQAILERIPEPYVIGDFPNPTDFKTTVALITGPGTAFPLKRP